MPTFNNKSNSVKQALIGAVMAISAVSLIASVASSTYIDLRRHKGELVSQLSTYSDIISFSSVAGLTFDDPETESEQLNSFKAAGMIENIHIYRLNLQTNEPEFFSSYNKFGIPPIPVKFSQIQALQNATFSDAYLEIIRPIKDDDNILGYVYLRASLASMKSDINEKLFINTLIGLFILLLAFLLALRMQRKITHPIESLLRTVQQVAKDKDYSAKVESINITELDILARAFNRMLERIQQHISKQAIAEQEVRLLNQSLEQKVNDRTQAVKDSNQELLSTLEKMHQYQNQLVETEKMASLGQMVAGIAHEVNTPIGLGVTASTLMQDRLAVILTSFENKKLSSKQLAKFLAESTENLGIIYRNLNRAAELISSFKQVAVDQSSEESRLFNFEQLIAEILMSLKPNLKKVQHQVIVECDPKINIKSMPGPITQIIINLVMNSLIHAFSGIDQGKITITVGVSKNNCQLCYKDNGTGVSEEIKHRIFDPFVTTRRGEGGSGLGMHLVYNLVTQALNGSITIFSEENKGIEFNIVFPIDASTSKTARVT
ncbi:MAG: signal transduction histidine kinase [Phenylobacterium sp.]|jgi:signal transduction histidine kinase